ncbi:MAG: hypothetical protein ACFFDW_13135, partial [Candidatus Thorarchaeota archaeon]
MLNFRFLTEYKDPKSFVEGAIEFIQKHVKDKKVFCALSGGIDSTATYLLLKKAGVNLVQPGIESLSTPLLRKMR